MMYYLVLFIVAMVLSLIYIFRWNRNYTVWYNLCAILIPVVNLGYFLLARSETVKEAMVANIITYLGGCFLQLSVFFCTLQLCQYKIPKGVVFASFLVNALVFMCVVMYDRSGLFYKSVDIATENGISYLTKEYGPIHSVFYALIIGYTVAGPVAVVVALARKKNLSIRTVVLLLMIASVDMVAFFAGRAVNKAIELMPLAYNLTMLFSIILASRISSYSIENSVSDSLIQNNRVGFFSFNKKREFVCCNSIASVYLKEILQLRTDRRISGTDGILSMLNAWMDEVDAQNRELSHIVNREEYYYDVVVQRLYEDRVERGYLFTVTDVTEKIKFQEELTEHAKQMQILKNEAEAASRAKGEFLANMSHEIRTPINAVLGMDEMILMESNDPKILEYATDIKDAGNTLLNLIGDILDFSKIESGKMDIVEVNYDPRKLFRDVEVLLRNRAEKKGLSLSTVIPDKLPALLWGDEIRIKQVIVNLMTNAIKYTEVGEVTLSVVCEENGEEATIKVAVTDTGVGIRAEDQKLLFDEFRRVDEAHNRNIEGTGLGLAITAKLLNLMGSEICLESEYGKGSTFYFEITQKIVKYNAAKGEEAHKDESGEQDAFEAPDANVLVVDDTPLNLKVVAGLLKKTKVQVTLATNGNDALKLMKEKHFDLIFMDHLMPDLDGIETLARSKNMENNRNVDTPVIILTANAITGARETYLEAGFTDYLSKPVNFSALNEMLRKYISYE